MFDCIGFTLVTESGQADPFFGDGKTLGQVLGMGHPIQVAAMEIKYLTAFRAIKMVVISQVGVKSPGVPMPFHHGDHTDLGEGEKGSVHRVQGDAGKLPGESSVDLFRTGMCGGAFQSLVNGHPLGGDF